MSVPLAKARSPLPFKTRMRARQPRLVAEADRRPLGLTRDRQHLLQATQLKERGTQVQAKIDRVLDRLQRLREVPQGGERLLERPHRFRSRRVQRRAEADLAVVGKRLRPRFSARSVKRELVGVARALVVEPLDRVHGSRVQDPALLAEQTRVADVAGECALEPIDDVGKEARLRRDTPVAQAGERPTHPLGRYLHDGFEERLRHVRADHRRRLQEKFLVER